MSNRQATDSKLHTWSGPVFPESILNLHTVFASFFGNIDGQELLNAASKVRHFRHRSGQEPASDGYLGFWTFTFAVDRGLLAIRFPLCNDEQMEDGTSTDRCVAAYWMCSGNQLPTSAIDAVADALRKELEAHPLFGKVRAPEFEPELVL